jgi:hypothetical protein
MSTETVDMKIDLSCPDVQQQVCAVIFRGELKWEMNDFYIDGMDCFMHCFDRSPEMRKAAVVCKAWHKKHREFLQAFFAKKEAQLWQKAVAHGLAMCGLARYEVEDQIDMEQHTEEYHSLQLSYGPSGDYAVMDLHLTRWKPDDAEEHTLAVETWTVDLLGRLTGDMPDFFEDMPVRLAQIPQLCFAAEDELVQAHEQIWQWKQGFAELTTLWLPTRRDAPGQAGAIEEWRREFGAWRKAWLDAQKAGSDSE